MQINNVKYSFRQDIVLWFLRDYFVLYEKKLIFLLHVLTCLVQCDNDRRSIFVAAFVMTQYFLASLGWRCLWNYPLVYSLRNSDFLKVLQRLPLGRSFSITTPVPDLTCISQMRKVNSKQLRDYTLDFLISILCSFATRKW